MAMDEKLIPAVPRKVNPTGRPIFQSSRTSPEEEGCRGVVKQEGSRCKQWENFNSQSEVQPRR